MTLTVMLRENVISLKSFESKSDKPDYILNGSLAPVLNIY